MEVEVAVDSPAAGAAAVEEEVAAVGVAAVDSPAEAAYST